MSKLEQKLFESAQSGMSRRDALKFMGLSPIAASVLASQCYYDIRKRIRCQRKNRYCWWRCRRDYGNGAITKCPL